MENVDISGMSETWLTAATPDLFVNISGYEIVWSDSPDLIRKLGVAMYVKKKTCKYEIVACSLSNVILFLSDLSLYRAIFFTIPEKNILQVRNFFVCCPTYIFYANHLDWNEHQTAKKMLKDKQQKTN